MFPPENRRLIEMLKLLGVAVFYALLFHLTNLYFGSAVPIRILEPASGLALAALLVCGKRYAWGVFLGALLVSAVSGNPWVATLGIALGDALAALLGA